LEKYHKALTHAIARFHQVSFHKSIRQKEQWEIILLQERMEVINRLVKELWKQTYKGNDIDYIKIKTDEIDPNAGIDKRKKVNYTVVMIKNGAELEMRGRCSAGQKVLASLIIRLALAETFSANCGTIALDEPTTNLDRDNIESLADALAMLVDKRSGVGNFQLLVITHDEDLIHSLGRHVSDQRYYYK
jgi:DNA repair protein RAD50